MKKILLTLIAMVLPLIGFAENQTAPTNILKSWVGDFTDTDNDGMTDVAELKYGYDPTDGNSFPNVTYHASDYSSTQTIDDGKFGGENDTTFYSFQSYDDATIEKYKRFLTKVLPIMYYRLGNPVKTQVVKFWNRYPSGSPWMTVATTNPMIYTDGSLNYRLIVHELFHAWSGDKGPGYRSKYNRLNKYEVSLTGWEEVADGIAQEILIDYIEAYPTDGASISLATKSGNQLFLYREFGSDLIQHKEWTHGGGFQVDGITTWARYGITSNVGRKFMVNDEIFYRKFFNKYYAIIEEDTEIRFDNESLINLYASITPTLNGVSTKAFLSSIPALRGTKLPNKFHAVARPTDNINANFQVFCGFADNHRGELWWSTSIRSKEALSGFGIPSWFPTFHADDGYFYADTRNEKYIFTVKNLQGEVVKQVEGQLNDTTRSDGGPSNLSPSYVSGCKLSNFELGLYKANVEFPRFKSVTDDYISEDTYLLGMSGFPFYSSTRYIVVGIDTTTQLASVSLKINEQVFTPVQVGENAVIFNIDSVAKNTRDEMEILVTSTQNQSHSFLRTLTLQGTPDRPKHTHNRFVIVDTDFDGVEDMYGSADDVKEEVVVDDTTTPIEDTTEEVVVVEDSLNFKVTHKDGVIRFTWNADFESHIADKRHLQVWWSKLGPVQGTFIWGGHAHDSAEFKLDDLNFNGTETIGIEVLDYFNNHYVRKGLKAFEVNLADVIANSTEQEVVVDDTTTPIEDNNDTEVVVDTPTKLEQEIKDQKVKITDLSILIIELRKQVADLNSSNFALTTEVSGLKTKVNNLNGQVASLTTENGELRGQVTNLREDNGNLQLNVTSLNEKLVETDRIAKTPFVHDWIYTPGHGWLHIDPQNFPIIYKNDTQTWHFYEQGSINPRYFYNFKEQKWEAWDLTE